MKITAVYPGTFDPITNGHVDIVQRAARLFDRVLLAVSSGGNKQPVFSLDERLALARAALVDYPDIEVIGFEMLVVEMARQQGATVLIRGLRAVSDFDYEFQMAGMNRKLYSEVETVFLTPAEQYNCISSSLVREIVRLGGDASEFVHPTVKQALVERIEVVPSQTKS
ncbi:MAG: pantetheine-phosphate adenylyltransferase [Gammaproteobacteria bacterium]